MNEDEEWEAYDALADLIADLLVETYGYRADLAGHVIATRIGPTLRANEARTWREGWLAGNRWAFTDADADAIETNPYQEAP